MTAWPCSSEHDRIVLPNEEKNICLSVWSCRLAEVSSCLSRGGGLIKSLWTRRCDPNSLTIYFLLVRMVLTPEMV